MTDSRGATPIEIGERLSEKELCPDELLAGQEAAFARDVERLRAQSAAFVDVVCPACGSRDGRPELEKMGFQYLACSSCSTLYMSPRPSPEIMAAYYANSENYRYWAEHIFPASENIRRGKIHRPWLERVLDTCRRFGVERGTLVDVGAGFGTFCAVANEAGAFARVVAVEPTPEMADACRSRGVEVVSKPVEELTTADLDSVDVVVAFEVIEHLFSAETFLRNCSEWLRPGGILILSCPNGQGFDISLLGAKSLAIDPEHVNLFNPASMATLLERVGMDLVETVTPGRLDAEFVHDAVERGELDLPPFLQRVLMDEWDRLGWPFQCFLAEHGLSSHMWTVARKPGGNAPRVAEPTQVEAAVRDCYSTWSSDYYDAYYAGGDAYPPVHTDLVRNLLRAARPSSLVDAGCGPASMLRDLVDLDIELYGFDLTPQMVVEARRVLGSLGIATERVWEGSVLRRGDFTRHAPPGGTYEAAICIGVLPHVLEEDDDAVLENLHAAVAPGGLVIVEARNELFSLFTLNRYSHEFFRDQLIGAEELVAQAGDDQEKVERALQELSARFRTDLPPPREGIAEGYDDVVSRTHNPLVLQHQMRQCGFADVALHHYHYHALPPMFEDRFPEIFRRASLARERGDDWRGLFMASAFMLSGRRA